MSAVTVRAAQATDRDGIRRVLLEAFEEHRGLYAPGELDSYLSSLVNDLDDSIHYVATESGGVVGVGSLYPPGATSTSLHPGVVPWPIEWAGLRRLAVAPSHRGRGIARQLIEARVQRARELGATAVGLHTTFPRARAMYRALGWQRVEAYDFEPLVGIVAEAYALIFSRGAVAQ